MLIESDSQPLDGEIRADRLEWEDIALTDTDRLSAGLRDLGLPDSEVAEGLAVARQATSDMAAINDKIDKFNAAHEGVSYFMTPQELLNLYQQRLSVRERLSDWAKARTIQVDRVDHCAIKIPVFVISAPDVPGCSAAFITSSELARNLACHLEIYGSGLSGGSRVSFRATCEFVTTAGNAKVVFVPAELTVGQISVLSHGVVINRGQQIQAIEFPDPEPAVAVIPSPAPGAKIRTYPLSGDTTGDLSTYGYEYQQSATAAFKVGVSAFGAELGLETVVTLDRSIELSYELKGGHDYSLHYLDEGQGISWQVAG